MTFFSRLLANRDRDTAVLDTDTRTEAVRTVPDAIPMAEELFIDREPPAQEVRTEPVPSGLKQLVAQDRTEEGRQAGYDHHDQDICRVMKERIKAEIMVALDHEIGRLTLLIDQLDVEVQRLQGGGMEVTLRELEACRGQMDRHRLKLHEQQLLVPGNTGLAEWPLASFETGFKQGYHAYLDATVLINKYQG